MLAASARVPGYCVRDTVSWILVLLSTGVDDGD